MNFDIEWALAVTHSRINLDNHKTHALPPGLGEFELLLVGNRFLPHSRLVFRVAMLGLLLTSCRNQSSAKEVLS